MKKKTIAAVLALVLVMQLCLTGCGKSEKEAKVQEADESIMLSNYVFPGMKQTDEQKKLMAAVQKDLSAAELECGELLLTVTNTTGRELDAVEIMVVEYDENGTCVGDGWVNIDSWENGSTLTTIMHYSGSKPTFEKAVIGATFQLGDGYVHTGFMPMTLKNAGSSSIDIHSAVELPLRFKHESSVYVVTSLETFVMSVNQGKVYGQILMNAYKESGPSDEYETFDYRLKDPATNTVYDSGSFFAYGLEKGGRILFSASFNLDPGISYDFELLTDSVKSIDAAEVPAEAYGPDGADAAEKPADEATPAPESTKQPSDVMIMKPDLDDKDDKPDSSGGDSGDSEATGNEWDDQIADARQLIDQGNYHDAAVILINCVNEYPESEEECDELLEEIHEAVKDNEPKTGELERTIVYQGGHQVHITAVSGPLEMTLTDVNNPSQYVRFYVRLGETSDIYVVSGKYKVTYKIGLYWFDDTIGFGDLCIPREFSDYLDVKTTEEGGWVTNWVWSQSI